MHALQRDLRNGSEDVDNRDRGELQCREYDAEPYFGLTAGIKLCISVDQILMCTSKRNVETFTEP